MIFQGDKVNKVSDYMTTDIICVDESRTVSHAIERMNQHRVSSLLVTGSTNKGHTYKGIPVVGIFTERDLLVKANFSTKFEAYKLKISSFMTSNLKTIDVETTYINAISLLKEAQVRHMPVVKDGVIVGIVSFKDLSDHYKDNLETLFKGSIDALALLSEKRDPYTAGHQRNVADLAIRISTLMGLDNNLINLAAIIHDVGKIFVPSAILNKPGRLAEEEFALIKLHPKVGHDIAKPIDFGMPIAEIIFQHHEKLDGSGYPLGITDKDILIESKVIAVADVVDAISSHRPYRPALGVEVALEEINKKKGIYYDPDVVDACNYVLKK